jgi:hypothetical protein
MKLADFFIALGIEMDESKLKRIDKSIKDFRNNIRDTAIAFTAAGYALDRFVGGATQGVAALKNFNQQTGLSVEKLQEWQQAAKLSNLTIEAQTVAASIQSLQRNIAEIGLGRGNASPFTILGIDVSGKDAFQVLEDVRNKIKGIDNATASVLLSDLGLDPAMLSVLRLTNEEFEKLTHNTFLSAKGREAVNSAGVAIEKLKMRFIALRDQAVARLAPQLIKLVNDFFGWINKNHQKVLGALSGFVKVFADFTNMISRAIGLLAEFAERILGVDNGIKFLGLAFGALMLSFRPFLLSLFLVLGLLEDIAVWKAGGKSAFGGLYEAIAGLVAKMKPFKEAIIGFKDNIKEAFTLDDQTKENMGLVAKTFEYLTKTASGTALGAIRGFKASGLKAI